MFWLACVIYLVGILSFIDYVLASVVLLAFWYFAFFRIYSALESYLPNDFVTLWT